MQGCAPDWLLEMLKDGPAEPLRLPLKSRDAGRLAGRLTPARGEEFYVWLVSRGGSCFACIVYGSSFSVDMEREAVRDPLSGLTMRLPVPSGRVDGFLVWRGSWRRGLLVVDSLNCHARVWPDGSVECRGSRCKGPSCLEHCRRVILGP
ncbi:hypothetical protein [Stetteria hydrogenophila]